MAEKADTDRAMAGKTEPASSDCSDQCDGGRLSAYLQRLGIAECNTRKPAAGDGETVDRKGKSPALEPAPASNLFDASSSKINESYYQDDNLGHGSFHPWGVGESNIPKFPELDGKDMHEKCAESLAEPAAVSTSNWLLGSLSMAELAAVRTSNWVSESSSPTTEKSDKDDDLRQGNSVLENSTLHASRPASQEASHPSLDHEHNSTNDQGNAGSSPALLFEGFKGSILKLMTDACVSTLFKTLLEECDQEQTSHIVAKVLQDENVLIHKAALSTKGSKSIHDLIVHVRRMDHAFTISKTFSRWLCYLMTNCKGKTVILDCLNYFLPQAYEPIYEQLMIHIPILAANEVGCVALKDCIDIMSGDEKTQICEYIASMAVFLSEDRYGNYVLQRVLENMNDDITAKILVSLKGRFVHLSQTKVGSHVVEKCIETSALGALCVAEEVLECPRIPIQLARHQFGNFVLQKLLMVTKIQWPEIHQKLVRAIEPSLSQLRRTSGGGKIARLIRDR